MGKEDILRFSDVVENSDFLKSDLDKEIFINAILNPPPPNESLIRAAENYKKLIETQIMSK